MEPLDEETKRWLDEAAKAADAKRAELYKDLIAQSDARKLAEARRVLGTIPASPSSRTRNFVSIFCAAQAELDVSAKIVEGVVFDIYNVMCGHMDGSDDFMAFDLITSVEEISSWRENYPQIKRGSTVRIKFIDKGNNGLSGDHIDDVVLEVWIDQ